MNTNPYPENSSGGIMLCGINHGGDSKKDRNPQTIREKKTFISNPETKQYDYKTALLNWFSIWGHPLEPDPHKAGSYEKSFFLTNWLPDSSIKVPKNYVTLCRDEHKQFCDTIRKYSPSIILITSVPLYDLLFNRKLRKEVEELLGNIEDGKSSYKYPPSGAQTGAQKFRAKLGRFSKGITIIGMPHPAARPHPNDDYIREAGRVLKIPELLNNYKEKNLG